LDDVAREAGVAKSTASYALSKSDRVSHEARERVLEAARRLGYAGPSPLGRALTSGRSRIVGIVTAAHVEAPLADPFALHQLDGAMHRLNEGGYAVLLLRPATDDTSRELLESVPFDGVITLRRLAGVEETDALIALRQVPVVSLDGHKRELDAVVSDEAGSIVQVLALLKALGHEKIATVTLHHNLADRTSGFVDWDTLPEADIPPTRTRLQGFRDAGVRPHSVYRTGYNTLEEGRAAGIQLLTLEDCPTAIVCQSDSLAAGVIMAAHDLGLKVPDDVSVTGFDAIDLPMLAPNILTSVFQDGFEKGKIVASYLLDLLDGKSPGPTTLTLSLRVGTTTGPAPRP